MISICMIVKNESKWIRNALVNFKKFSSQIVVVDTGSTDNTIEIARELGAEIYSFEWNNDFAEARNFSLTKATQPWIFCLDADEIIAETDIPALDALTNNPWPQAYRFKIRNYTQDSSVSGFTPITNEYPEYTSQHPGFFESRRIKLFRNNAGIKFEGQIHELVEGTVMGTIMNADTPIHHFGHLPDEMERKNKSSVYLASLENKVSNGHKDWVTYFQLGLAKAHIKMFKEAVIHFRQALELKKAAIVYSHLGACLNEVGERDEAEEIFTCALKIHPDNLDLLNNYAVLKVEKQDWIAAADLFQTIIDKYPDSFLGYRGFGYALMNLNRLDQARKMLEKSLSIFPAYEDAKIDLGIIHLSEGRLDTAKQMAKSVMQINPNSSRALGLLQTLENVKFPQI